MAFPRKKSAEKDSLAIQLFGNRINAGQTLGEYLLEFLLVFASAKCDDKVNNGQFEFHTSEQVKNAEDPSSPDGLNYFTVPRNGLKRFIFYARSKQDSHTAIDDEAYQAMMQMVMAKCEDPEWAYMLQDLLYGYALVIKKRGWYAQSLTPIAPELLFPETLGVNARKAKSFDAKPINVETAFSYGSHDFLARGGEMYYLHLLYGIYKQEGGKQYKEKIEQGIRYMLTEKSSGFTTIANKLQNWWLENQEIDREDKENRNKLVRTMNLEFLQDGFGRRSLYSLEELSCFLSNELHPIQRIELLTKGVVLTLLRCMHLQAYYTVHKDDVAAPEWILDLRAGSATSNVAKLAARSYREAYAEFGNALNFIAQEMRELQETQNKKSNFQRVSEALTDPADVFKKMGKEIELVIPPKGAYERFSLSEDLVRYLVLSLVPPDTKMTFDTFLKKLYDHFGMVIGPEQYNGIDAEPGMKGYLTENKDQFQEFLKSCGLLRDLSDATSIVVNPYAGAKYLSTEVD